MDIRTLLQQLTDLFGSQAADPAPAAADMRAIAAVPPARPACFVIEDDVQVRDFLSEVLTDRGIEVAAFSGVSDAMIERVAARKPDLILLDVALENSDAVEALLALARLKYDGMIQLISGRGGDLLNDVRRIGRRHKLKMLPALEKPLRLHVLTELIDRLFLPGRSRTPSGISLSASLESGWCKVWYQPKIDLRRNCLVGIEALVRIEHPAHGIVLPHSFLPRATVDDLTRLSEHVLITVLRDWPEFYAAGGPLIPAINIPVSVLSRLPLVSLYRQHAPKDPAWSGMIVELNERQIIDDIKLATEIATQFKIYDIKLSVDDFGEGFSSFSRLRDIPFSELKIDDKFVNGCAQNPVNRAICGSVIDLAHRLGCLAVAEGVEREEDLRALHAMGCDLVQGFLLARPMTKERLISLLQRRRERQQTLEMQQPAMVA